MNIYKKRSLLPFIILICCTFFQITPGYGGFEEEDYDMYRGKSTFGTLHGTDLDMIHGLLATDETIVSNKCGQKGIDGKTEVNKTNNIVFGALSLILKKGGTSRVVTIDLTLDSPEEQSQKRKVFESASTYALYKNPELSPLFSFDEDLPSVDILSNHVGKIWGAKGDGGVDWTMKPGLPMRETYIWNDFEFLRKNIEISKENLRSFLPKIASEISSMCVPLSSLALTLETKDHPLSFAQLIVFQQKQGKDETPSHVLSRLITTATQRQAELENAEDDLKSKINNLYRYFGHSEQKMLNFLMGEECGVFDELIDLIDEDETVEGALLHVHSRYNFCQTCRRALIRTSAPEGFLRAKLEDRLKDFKSDSFYFKVLASFRVMYYPGIWMSYNVPEDHTGEQLHPEDLTPNAPQLFLNKINRYTEDEVQKDKEYYQQKHTPFTFQSGLFFPQPPASSPIAASSLHSAPLVIPPSSSSVPTSPENTITLEGQEGN
ncbi:hypothetical protein QM565_19390 [Geitlerinema splendidum]|nr:hypothetical protein [Geitlerinema splendidum]